MLDFFQHRARRLVTVCALLSFVACASRPTRPSASPEKREEAMGPAIQNPTVDSQEIPQSSNENYGPKTPDVVIGAPGAAETPAPSPAPSSDSAKLCLVLGPGMAKAIAEAAVLDAIRRAHLPVHCVVGTEMGAIVGALYAFSNGSTNNLQWQLFKLNKDNYLNFPMLSLREPRSSGHRLHEYLEGVFGNARIESLPIRFATTAIDESDATIEFLSGSLTDALSASTAVPGIFDTWRAGGVSFRSAAVADPAPVELARKLGGNFIVLVDVLLDGGTNSKSRFHRAFTSARSLIRLQKKEASFVIQVNTSAIGFDEFERRGEISSAGAAAAEKALPELKAAWEKWVAGSR